MAQADFHKQGATDQPHSTGRLSNFDALIRLFDQFGLILELPQPSQQEIARFLSASIVERKMAQQQDRLSWFVIRDGSMFQRVSPDNWGRILLELMHEKTIVQAYRYLMNRVGSLEILKDRTTRFYFGYKDESAIWS